MITADGTDFESGSEADSSSAVPVVVIVLIVVATPAWTAIAVAGNAATHPSASPSFVVDLAGDGTAQVTLTLTYDLESEDERTAFRTLRNDSETRADARDRFRSRMAAVASDVSNATGRDMAVSEATIDVRVSDDGHTGVVTLGVTWSNLAATEDGALVVTEPFASGFEPDRPFTVRGPDGYERASASPTPDGTGPNAATWEAGADLSGFEVVFEPTGGSGGSNGGGSDGGIGGGVGVPGFGAVVALVALAAAAIAVARRR